jgi:hypothetical protein
MSDSAASLVDPLGRRFPRCKNHAIHGLSTRSMSANLPNVHCLRPLQPILPLLFSEPWVSAYGAPGVPDGTRVMRKYMALSDAFAAMVSGDVAPAT